MKKIASIAIFLLVSCSKEIPYSNEDLYSSQCSLVYWSDRQKQEHTTLYFWEGKVKYVEFDRQKNKGVEKIGSFQYEYPLIELQLNQQLNDGKYKEILETKTFLMNEGKDKITSFDGQISLLKVVRKKSNTHCN